MTPTARGAALAAAVVLAAAVAARLRLRSKKALLPAAVDPDLVPATKARGFVFPHDTVRWGIIGCGDVCEKKAGPPLHKAVGSSLVAVMRRTKAAAKDFAVRHNVPRAYDSVDALLADPEVNAIYIASPVGSHLEHAKAVAKAGLPCLLEKPMARCAEEAEQIVSAFREAGVPLWTAYYRRSHGTWLKLRQMLEQGELGTVLRVDYELRKLAPPTNPAGGKVPWRFDAEHAGGGLVMDVGSHVVDLLEFLLGPLEITRASASQSAAYHGLSVEDWVEFDFVAAGALGSCRWDFAQPAGRPTFELLRIVGTAATIEARPLASDGLRLVKAPGSVTDLALPPPANVHHNLVQGIVNELLGQCESQQGPGLVALPVGPCPADEGIKATRHLDHVLAPFYGGSRQAGPVPFWSTTPPDLYAPSTPVAP